MPARTRLNGEPATSGRLEDVHAPDSEEPDLVRRSCLYCGHLWVAHPWWIVTLWATTGKPAGGSVPRVQ